MRDKFSLGVDGVAPANREGWEGLPMREIMYI